MASKPEQYSIVALIDQVKNWHEDRNLIAGSTDKDQYMKLIQEAGELSDNICKGKDIRDDIGDMLVVLINIAERNDLTLTECLYTAWEDIKDRKGLMVDGVFVKELDVELDEEPVEFEYWTEESIFDDWITLPEQDYLDEETEVTFYMKDGRVYEVCPDEATLEEKELYAAMLGDMAQTKAYKKSWLED
jgi:hypothetical protein